jgi:hypothetical protein
MTGLPAPLPNPLQQRHSCGYSALAMKQSTLLSGRPALPLLGGLLLLLRPARR